MTAFDRFSLLSQPPAAVFPPREASARSGEAFAAFSSTLRRPGVGATSLSGASQAYRTPRSSVASKALSALPARTVSEASQSAAASESKEQSEALKALAAWAAKALEAGEPQAPKVVEALAMLASDKTQVPQEVAVSPTAMRASQMQGELSGEREAVTMPQAHDAPVPRPARVVVLKEAPQATSSSSAQPSHTSHQHPNTTPAPQDSSATSTVSDVSAKPPSVSSAEAVPLSAWSLAEFKQFVKDTVLEREVDTTKRINSRLLPFDPDEEVKADYADELRESDQSLRFAHVLHRSADAAKTTGDSGVGKGEVVMSATVGNGDRINGKWHIPEHIPVLRSSTEDYDWWFYLMRQHLDHCCLTRQDRWHHYYKLQCHPTFYKNIRARLRTEKIEPAKVLTHPYKFQEYVCLRYTPRDYPKKIIRRIFELHNKKLDIHEAWDEVCKLVFCYNECMRRRKQPQLTEEDHISYFIHALKDHLFPHLNTLFQQDHPSMCDAEEAFATAVSYENSLRERARNSSSSPIDPEQDQVLMAPLRPGMKTIKKDKKKTDDRRAGKKNRKRGQGKKKEKQTAMVAAAPAAPVVSATSTAPTTPSVVPPPPPSTFAPPSVQPMWNPQWQQPVNMPPPMPLTHMAFAAPEELRCFCCGRTGHIAANCPDRINQARQAQQQPTQQNQQSSLKPRSKLVCTHCGKTGHTINYCWDKYPNLRQAKSQSRTRPQQHQGKKNTKEVAAVAEIGQAPAVPPPPKRQRTIRWTHSADPGAQQDSVFFASHVAAPPMSNTMPSSSGTRRRRLATSAQEQQQLQTVSETWQTAAYAFLAPPDSGRFFSMCRCLPKVETMHGGEPFQMVIDTGATVNLVKRGRIDPTVTPEDVPSLPITNVSGGVQNLTQRATMLFDINAYPYVFDFYLANTLPADALIGIDGIIEAGWVIDIFNRCLYHLTHALPPIMFAPCPHTAQLAYAATTFVLPPRSWKRVAVSWSERAAPEGGGELVLLTPTTPSDAPVHGAPVLVEAEAEKFFVLLCNNSDEELHIEQDSPVAYREPCEVLTKSQEVQEPKTQSTKDSKAEKLKVKPVKVEQAFSFAQAAANWDHKYVKQLKRLFAEYRNVWDHPDIVGRSTKGEHRVDTGDAQPIALPMRRCAWTERDLIHDEVMKMKKQKVVVESESPWSSPPVLVRKKDGTVRFCIDYRRLNDVTVPDQYPLPRIDDVLDALDEGRFFSVIDLKSGYWQIPMRPEDAGKTAFRTADGLFQFTVMPFGLRNAPATFQRLMDVVFSGLKWKGLLVYMDDIIIYSATASEHLGLIANVLSRLSQAGLKLNPKKTTLVSCEVKYLGHVVSAEGVKPDPKKVSAVAQLVAPSNVREVRSFLGLAGYYRRFVDAFAAVAAPLYELTKKNVPFVWGERQQAAFDLLKERLCTAPILAYPRRDRDFRA